MPNDTAPDETLEFHLDCFLNGCIMGWVRDTARPDKPVGLQLCLGSRRISVHRGDRYRPDLEAEGVGSGRYGFEITVPVAVMKAAEEEGEPLTIVATAYSETVLCRLDLNTALDVPWPLIDYVADRLDASRAPSGPVPPALSPGPSAAPPSYLGLLSEGVPALGDRPALFPYAEHVRVMQQEDAFSPSAIGSDYDHFLRWYLDHYNALRAPRRAPLSRDVIAWLNEPVVIGGVPFTATRVMLWYLSTEPGIDGLRSLGDEARYNKLAYWWAADRAPALNAEDCLVPQYLIDHLSAVSPTWEGQRFPLSRFMEEALASRSSFGSFGPMHSVSARVTAYLVLIVEALDEPGLLRFMPVAVRRRLFDGAAPLFDDLAGAACAGRPDARPMTAGGYRAALVQRGFDLDAARFTSVDRDGHRSEAARLGGGDASAGPQPDVRLIGPLHKVSGVAHATRLSRRILAETSLAVVSSDFSIDNPQPEQRLRLRDSPVSDGASHLAAARVNLIHLNAEMLPLAFAYLPDLHQGAYQIGFWFWELDQPAECHRLALELVDEIWVSSEYNRRCFAAWTDKPVVNVGMALEMAECPAYDEARTTLLRLCNADRNAFVVLTTFDSLSYVSRKNPLGTVRAFGEAFAGDDKARLLVKTHNAAAIADEVGRKVWGEVLRRAAADPRIVVIDETLPYADVLALKAGSDCYLSLHRSEGFGFGMLEAMRLGVPVVCTAYSGNLDFCDETTAWMVGADEIGVRVGEYAYVAPGHRWAEPRHDEAVAALRGLRNDPARAKARAAVARAKAQDHYGIPAAAKRYAERLDAILAGRPPRTMDLRGAGKDLRNPSRSGSESPGERRSLFGRLRGA